MVHPSTISAWTERDPISLTNSAVAQPGKTSTPAKRQHRNLSGQFYFGSQKSRIFRANAHSKFLERVKVISGSKAKHPVLAQGRPRPLRDIGLISGDCIHVLQCHQRTVRSLHRASADVLAARIRLRSGPHRLEGQKARD